MERCFGCVRSHQLCKPTTPTDPRITNVVVMVEKDGEDHAIHYELLFSALAAMYPHAKEIRGQGKETTIFHRSPPLVYISLTWSKQHGTAVWPNTPASQLRYHDQYRAGELLLIKRLVKHFLPESASFAERDNGCCETLVVLSIIPRLLERPRVWLSADFDPSGFEARSEKKN